MIKSHTSKVIFVDDGFLGRLKEQSISAYELFNEPQLDTEIIPLSSDVNFVEELSVFVDVSDMRPGNIVARTSYNDQFSSLDFVLEDIQTRKYELLCRFCIALGATKVCITKQEKIIIEAGSQANIETNIGAEAPFAKGSMESGINRSSQAEDNQESLHKFTTIAAGGQPDFGAAEAMIKSFKLNRDSLFCDLLEMRKLQTNKLKSHELVMDFSRDVKKLLDNSIMARFEAMSKIYSGSAEIQVAKKAIENNKTATKLTIIVEF